MTTVPIWQHIIAVLALLTSNFVTFAICKRKLEHLQAALVAKRVLLGRFEGSFEKREHVASGQAMILQDANHNVMEIRNLGSCDTELEVKVFDR